VSPVVPFVCDRSGAALLDTVRGVTVLSVRCRVCHDELLKACAEVAALKAEVAGLRKELTISRAKSRRYKQEQKAAEARAEVAEWFGRE
jgi:predicted adenine nucleotide alpha hydrolase (AANH) superfamily ATPase